MAYAGFRFLTEWLRPEAAWALGLTFYQWVCLAMIAALALQWAWDRSHAPGLPVEEASVTPTATG
jgi:hypothetical protein